MKYLKHSYLLLSAIVLLVSCGPEEENEVFDNPAAVRSQLSVGELYNTLIGQTSGYKAVYYTQSNIYGGFTTFLNFSADGTVKQTSDYLSNSDIDESLFEVRAGTTTELIFVTRNNHITEAVNPTYAGYNESSAPIDLGNGLRGTNNFQFFSNVDGVLTFRDIRNRNTGTLILTPTSFSNFDIESVQEIEAIKDVRLKLIAPPSNRPDVNSLFRVQNTNGESLFNASNNLDRRVVTIARADENGIAEEFSFGYHITKEGFTVQQGFEFEGTTYFDFVYQQEDNSFISTAEGTTAQLYFGSEVVQNPFDIEALLQLGPRGFLYRRSLGANPLTSGTHDAMFNTVDTNINQGLNGNFRVSGYQLILDFESDDCDTFLVVQLFNDLNNNGIQNSTEGTVNIFFCYEAAEIMDGKLFLTYLGPSGNTPAFTVPLVQPLLDFIGNPNGLIFSREGSFTSDTAAFSNTAGTFTSFDDNGVAEIRVYGLFF